MTHEPTAMKVLAGAKHKASSAMALDATSSSEAETGGGRKRARHLLTNEPDIIAEPDTGDEELSTVVEVTSEVKKTKKRTRKTLLGKLHKCGHIGCDKSYTRAEHLHRHELSSHEKPKEYTCERPNCTFKAFRKDLLDRHVQRHLKDGSTLNRRDTKRARKEKMLLPAKQQQQHQHQHQHQQEQHQQQQEQQKQKQMSSPNSKYIPRTQSQSIRTDSTYGHNFALGARSSTYDNDCIPSHFSPPDSSQCGMFRNQGPIQVQAPLNDLSPMNAMQLTRPYDLSVQPTFGPTYQYDNHQDLSLNSLSVSSPQMQFHPSTVPGADLPHNSIETMIATVPQEGPNAGTVDTGPSTDTLYNPSLVDLDSILEYNKNDPFLDYGGPDDFSSHTTNHARLNMSNALASLWKGDATSVASSQSDIQEDLRPLHSSRATPHIQFVDNPVLPRDRLNCLAQFCREGEWIHVPQAGNTSISRQDYRALLVKQLESHHDTFARNSYDAYWNQFDPQFPIVHRPTLEANQARDAEDLLLLAIIMVGSALLHGSCDIKDDDSSEIADFIAYNIRWKLQNHSDYRPPTKTWVLQALVLLEAYEKLYSKRLLHERAYTFHACTFSLLRRGNALRLPDPMRAVDKVNDEGFIHFFEVETTKRIAFACFMIDTFHANMFSHPASLGWNELELVLPCPPRIWQCATASQLRNAVQELEESSTQSIRFRECTTFPTDKRLTEMIRKQENIFVSMVILAGLISFSYEIQRISQFDIHKKRAGHMLRHWYQNFTRWGNLHLEKLCPRQDDYAFELLCGYRLAQITTRISVIRLQRFARATTILGRKVTLKERAQSEQYMQRRMPHDVARVAVCHGFKLLTKVFRVESDPSIPTAIFDVNVWEPCNEALRHKPWAVYMSMLTIWAYAYTVEGPLPARLHDSTQFKNDAEEDEAANRYLHRLPDVSTPGQLLQMKEKNNCRGLLLVLSRKFKRSRWELLQEAGERLKACADMLLAEALFKPVKEMPEGQETQLQLKAEMQEVRKEREDLEALEKQLERQLESITVEH